jgi:DNA-directed RNA polymerase specialized sigma54-like protein
LVKKTNATLPLADEKLKDRYMLKDAGYNIARRRTVAKYREQMNIPVVTSSI